MAKRVRVSRGQPWRGKPRDIAIRLCEQIRSTTRLYTRPAPGGELMAQCVYSGAGPRGWNWAGTYDLGADWRRVAEDVAA